MSSIEEEKKYLLSNIRGNNLYYYQEPSNNEDAWLFLGNKLFWNDPTIEFVLVEKIVEKDSDYWMPHIQIDLDTTLTSKEIIELISEVYSKKITPFPIVIDGITYIERCFLGRIDGINIFLDLATNSRNVKLLKERVWKEIS